MSDIRLARHFDILFQSRNLTLLTNTEYRYRYLFKEKSKTSLYGKNSNKGLLKGIVSRDWGALQIILLDRYIVGSISAEGYF